MRIGFVYNLQRSEGVEEAEFDTEKTIGAIHNALASHGDTVIDIEMTRDGSWIQRLKSEKPDLVFNTAEGFAGIGRESYAPIVFEQLKIPYVGSGPYCCFLTLDKFLTKRVVSSRGVPVPEGYYISDSQELKAVSRELGYPVFTKPNFEGSSKGITARSLCRTQEDFLSYGAELLRDFPDGIVVERFIGGRDVSVPFVNGLGAKGVLAPIEYVTTAEASDEWIYDYDLKNVKDAEVGVRCPARIPQHTIKALQEYVLSCVQSLGAVDMARADFRVTSSGEPYFIEFNALPSLQPGAGIFEGTREMGLTYDETIQQIVQSAINRLKLGKSKVRPARRLPLRDPKVALVYNLKRKKPGDEGYELEAEFDSQATVDAIGKCIEDQGYEMEKLEATRDLASRLLDEEIDVVFNIAEGASKRAREAQVPAVCDLLGIEHTGSDATCLAISLDKSMASKIVAAEGILTPRSKLFTRPSKSLKHSLNYPIIIKPNQEGTSKGVYDSSVVNSEEELLGAANRLWAEGITSVLCEEYIEGREFTVGVLEFPTRQVVGPMEVEFKKSDSKYPVYSFEAKQLDDQLDNDRFRLVCPVELPEKTHRKIQRFAKKSFDALGCRDVARIDFRMTAKEDLYFIEVNPLPGLSPGFSDLIIMGDKLGMNYSKIIESILMPAVRRWRRYYRARALEVGTEA